MNELKTQGDVIALHARNFVHWSEMLDHLRQAHDWMEHGPGPYSTEAMKAVKALKIYVEERCREELMDIIRTVREEGPGV